MTCISRPLSAALFLGVLLLTRQAPLAAECTADAWSATTFYSRGDVVSYVGHEWRAKRNTEGVPPGTHKPTWADLGACDAGGGEPPTPTPLQIFGVWHCGNSFCDWSSKRDTSPGGEFDLANRWIIQRDASDESSLPSVNLVVLSFLEPMILLTESSAANPLGGVPAGMTGDVVNYFKNRGIRVMVSMGGVTYTDAWNGALLADPQTLAERAFGVVQALELDGLEIDWENGRPTEALISAMEEFITHYRAIEAAEGVTDKFLTLDLAVGNRYLQELSRRAAADWLPNGKIDYVNAMVPRGEPSTEQWQEHIDGKPQYDPPILPKAPGKIAVSLWLTDGRRPNENCVDYENSSMREKLDYVQTVAPNPDGPGETPGFLGFMLWAAECPATRNVCTTPPDSCEGGMGVAADTIEFQAPFGTW